MLRKFLLMSVAAAALVLAAASAATADPPTRTFLPFGEPIVGEFCPGVQVEVASLINNGYVLAFGSGAMITTGRFVVSVTNLSTGKSVVVNASGPVKQDADGTFTLRGETLVFGAPGDFGPGTAADTYMLSGVLSFAPDGTVTQRGHIIDLCSQIS